MTFGLSAAFSRVSLLHPYIILFDATRLFLSFTLTNRNCLYIFTSFL